MEAGISQNEQSNSHTAIKQKFNPDYVEIKQDISTNDAAIEHANSDNNIVVKQGINDVHSNDIDHVIKDVISTNDLNITISSGCYHGHLQEQKQSCPPTSRLAVAYDFCTAGGVVVSSVLYLVDVATTVLAARSYRSFDRRAGYTGPNGAFTAIICMMVTAHLLNAVIFWLTLPKEEQPLKQAYFFPLIQLWRLCAVLRTGFRGRLILDEPIHSAVTKPTYYILAASLEAGPQLFLQAFVLLGPNSGLTTRAVTRESVFIYLSIFACILNAAYNGAIAVRLVSRDSATWQRSLAMAIAGGLYVSASMLLRCQGLMITALAPFTHSHYHRKLILPAFFLGIITNFTHFIFLLRNFNHSTANSVRHLSVRLWLLRAVECLALSGASYTVGPLYAMLKLESKYNISDHRISTISNAGSISDQNTALQNGSNYINEAVMKKKTTSVKELLITYQRPRKWTFYVHLTSACSTHLIVDMALAGVFVYLRSRQTQWHVDVCRDSKIIVWRCSEFFYIFSVLFTVVIVSVAVYCMVEIWPAPPSTMASSPPVRTADIPPLSVMDNKENHNSEKLHLHNVEAFSASSSCSSSYSASFSSSRSQSKSKNGKEQELPMLVHMAC